MRRAILAAFIPLALTATLAAQRRGGWRDTAPESEQRPPLARSVAEKRILDTISDAARAGELYANVPAADGRMLRLLAESVNASSVVEFGTSTGISGLWFTIALVTTGGHLTTFEIDRERAATARAHFKKAQVDHLVTVVEGDAHRNLKKLRGPVDVVFIDAEKDGYLAYLEGILPLVRPGGLILAHNVDMVPNYCRAVTSNADLETTFYMQGGGLAVTLKKR